MPQPTAQPGELACQGEAIYRQQIEPQLAPAEQGRFLVVDVDSADYEIADSDAAATSRLRKRHPEGRFYGVRIGHRAAYRLGARALQGEP